MMTARRSNMTRYWLFVVLTAIGMSAFADANDGEYLGYRLGEKFEVPRGAISEEHIMGALIYIVDPGRQPHHIDSMSIYVSPKTAIIGSIFGEWYFSTPRAAEDFADRYLASLESKYSHWRRRGRSLSFGDYQLWVEVEEKPLIVDYWPSHKNSRVAIGLIYSPGSIGRSGWMALVNREVNNLELTASD